MPTFFVKFASCALAVASGLPIGPEGPLVHMGAIIGSAVSSMHSVTLGLDLGVFKHLRGNHHRRDFVTAGVAAGITSAFHAPIGGLLFAMEEVSSFWHMELGMQARRGGGWHLPAQHSRSPLLCCCVDGDRVRAGRKRECGWVARM